MQKYRNVRRTVLWKIITNRFNVLPYVYKCLKYTIIFQALFVRIIQQDVEKVISFPIFMVKFQQDVHSM